MTKGTYTLHENVEGTASKYDSSYKSCLCALLVFFAICLIILLTGLFWTAKKVSDKVETVKEDVEELQHRPDVVYTREREKYPYSRKPAVRTTIPVIKSTVRTTILVSSTPKLGELTLPVSTTAGGYENYTSWNTNEKTIVTVPSVNYDTYTEEKGTKSMEDTTTEHVLLDNKTPAVEFTSEIEKGVSNSEKENETTFETTEPTEKWLTNMTQEDTTIDLEEKTSNSIDTFSASTETVTDSDTSSYPAGETSIRPENDTFGEVQDLQTTITEVIDRKLFDTLDSKLRERKDDEHREMITSISETTDEILFHSSMDSVEIFQPTTSISKTVTPKLEFTKSASTTGTKEEIIADASTTTATLKKSAPVCLTSGCKSAASRMLSLMDHSADACEDFYGFACGGMRTYDGAESGIWRALSAQLYGINSASPSFLQKYATFYDDCVEYEYAFKYEDRMRAVKQLLEEVGSIHDGPGSASIDITDLFAKLILRSSLPFMDVDLDIDKESSNFVLQLTLPGKSSAFSGTGHWSAVSGSKRRCLNELRDRLRAQNLILTEIHDVYLNCLRNHSIYLNSIETVVRTLGYFSHLHTYNQTQRIQELRVTIEWDVLDPMNSVPPDIRKDIINREFKVLKVSDLQLQYSFLDWKKCFKILTGKDVTDATRVQVYFTRHFSNLFKGLEATSKWRLSNALISVYAHEIFETLVIPAERDTRQDYCLKLSAKLFPDITSLLYVQSWATEQKEKTEKFFTKVFVELKHNFSRALQKVDWLDDSTRTSMLLKVQQLSLVFNKHDDVYNNKDYMEHKYSSLNMIPGDFRKNLIEATIFQKRSLYEMEGQLFSSNLIWGKLVNSYDTKPLSIYPRKAIVFPDGVLRKYDVTLPAYVTMGQVGLTIAREIGHHFDPVGLKYGVPLNGSQKGTYTSFETTMKNILAKEITRNIGKQSMTLQLDPALSMKERIADNTALRLITEYFYTLDQELLLPWIKTTILKDKIFFIAVAQEYCTETNIYDYMVEAFETEILPAPLRLENIVSNSEAFSRTFECPEGSKMNDNPAKSQFPYLQKTEDYGSYNYDNENYKDMLSN